MQPLDLHRVPFSRFGSYMAFSMFDGKGGRTEIPVIPAGLYFRTIRGNAAQREIFRVELVRNGTAVPMTVNASPASLVLEAEGAKATLVFPEPDILRMRVEGATLRFSLALPVRPYRYEFAIPVGTNRWQVNIWPNLHNYLLTTQTGSLSVTAPWNGSHCDGITADFGPGDSAIEEFRSTCPPGNYPAFEGVKDRAGSLFADWLKRTLPAPAEYAESRELASYINWATVVNPCENLTRRAMYMSKNWMTNIWSWDHCFNALALAKADPDLAWDQFMVMFDFQDADGAMPDSVNDRMALWNFVKPPVHGWTIDRFLLRNEPAFADRLKEAYEPLSRWTSWWMDHRDSDGDGIPEYNHGNDSGWDNATVFKDGCPVEASDLTTYLIIQMNTLAGIATRLGKASESSKWRESARTLQEKFMKHSWRNGRFVSPRSGSHSVAPGDSLIDWMPAILGDRLPGEVRKTLLEEVSREGRFLTKYGLATENPSGPHYVSDGYWLGPLWAPPTLMLADALAEAGNAVLAKRIAKGWCDMCAREGFAENFDALTGAGYRDRAYTWTSSVFLLLAEGLI
jgi:hypothetical protein